MRYYPFILDLFENSMFLLFFFVVVVPCDLLSSNSREFHLFRAFNITSEYKLQAAKDLVWWKKNLVFWAVQFKGQSRWRKWVLIFLEIKSLTGIFRVLCCFLCVLMLMFFVALGWRK